MVYLPFGEINLVVVVFCFKLYLLITGLHVYHLIDESVKFVIVIIFSQCTDHTSRKCFILHDHIVHD